jgi:molecular chaperone Hsp33
MRDQLASAIHEQHGLTASVVVVTSVARELRARHQMSSVSADLFAQALASAALLVSPQKSDTRLNFQLECDGPLGGLFVDASSRGELRGYVKNPLVALKGSEGPYRWRAALGNNGYVSVLRDQGQGEYYRSSVQLQEFAIEGDLRHFFRSSEQIATALCLHVSPEADEPLGVVAGAMVQLLPQGDPKALDKVEAELSQRLKAGLSGGLEGRALAAALLGEGARTLSSRPLELKRTCSKARVMATLAALGRDDLIALHKEQGRTSVTCQMCGSRHEVSGEELLALAQPS